MKLIFGCGYLGGHVAKQWLAAGEVVAAVTRTRQRAVEFQAAGLQPIVADVTRPESLGELPAAQTVLYAVGFDARSGHSRRQVHVEGLHAVLDALPVETGRVIFISSTGVYGETGGQWVDEESPCRPTREVARAMLAAEQLLGSHRLGPRSIVLRMAGLYGPGRIPRIAPIRAGDLIPVAVGSWLNLIHVDDAAAVVLAADKRAQPPRTYVVSDGHPVDRRECLCYLAQLLGAPAPRFVDPPPQFLESHHSGSNKRANNARMLAEFDIRLLYPTYREGMRETLNLER